MQIGSGDHRYNWNDSWAKMPDTESARAGFSHTNIVVTQTGNVVTFHQGDPTVLTFDRDGNLLDSWDSGLTNAHDMVLVQEGGADLLWLVNNESAAVVKTTLDGQRLMSLNAPDLPVYRDGTYAPTSISVDEERLGGNGDIWVADGYGESYVHRYDKSGAYVASINGKEGPAGAFNQPHGIFIDRRRSEPEIYIADRRNARVQVYDLEGRFKRAFGDDHMITPSGFIAVGDHIVIVEHRGARLTVLDADDRLVCYLGENRGISELEGWPNISRDLHQIGKFNSPHGVAPDADGNLDVVEWLVGGRTVKLAKA